MKNKQLLCVLFPLLVACTGQRHQQQVSSESIIEEAVRKGEVLKGEIVPIDTALFRYAYRMRVQGDNCLLYTSPSPRDVEESRMPSSA